MSAIIVMFLFSLNVYAAAPSSPPARRTLSEVLERLRQGITSDQDDWNVLEHDEDHAIPALLDLIERPGRSSPGYASFAIGGYQDYHLQNHISPKNLKLIARRSIGFLSSSDRDVRNQGLGLLSAYPDSTAIDPLKKFIQGSAPNSQRVRAEQTLVYQLGSPAALDSQRSFFESLRDDPDYAVSSAARRVLAQTYKDPAEVRRQAKEANTEYGSIDAAAKALGTGNDWMMRKASEELVRDGIPALRTLISLGTTHDEPEVRQQAIAAVRKIVQEPGNRTQEAAVALAECLRTGTREAGWCADDLGGIDTPEAHDALVSCALAPGDARYACLDAIRTPWSKGEIPKIRTLLGDKNDHVKTMAAYILAQDFDDSGLAILRAAVDAIASKAAAGDSPEGRATSFNAAHVVDAFAYIGDESDLEKLRTLKVPSKLYQRDIDRRIEHVAQGVELRTKHGGRDGQILFLKRQFEEKGEYVSLYWLSLLMGERAVAEYLLPLGRAALGSAPSPAGSQAIQWLMSNGWVDQMELMRGNKNFVLRDRPIKLR